MVFQFQMRVGAPPDPNADGLIDYKKAFETLPHSVLLVKLKRLAVDGAMRDFIARPYSASFVQVLIGDTLGALT